ncbi:MAG: 7-cyano-7-deazaguanine synthase, partial [Candidatus Omnitrophica bacterium]|nr:7-cyano-7-deazaguanine synthase [Candidatus Omnitrophota bacterium]
KCGSHVVNFSLPWQGSSLIDNKIAIPSGSIAAVGQIPNTYVPARNIIFLSFAVSFAEVIDAKAVFIGAHQLDFSNYPDCRSVFFDAFQTAVSKGTKTGSLGKSVKIVTPIINMTKKEIVKAGAKLGVPFDLTWSCYKNGKKPCGTCESCMLRARGFKEAWINDPLVA